MSFKMGRLKVDNFKNIDVKVRFDENIYKKLLDYCEKENFIRIEVIRKGVDLFLEEDK